MYWHCECVLVELLLFFDCTEFEIEGLIYKQRVDQNMKAYQKTHFYEKVICISHPQ